jgi:hypothetical protein
LLIFDKNLQGLQSVHQFAELLSLLNRAQEVEMDGVLVEELAIIVFYQSRARLLQRSVQLCIEYDDMTTLAQATQNGRYLCV